MAIGEFHFGKKGPEKCKADPSNPRSKGCPFGATGHYANEAEALETYATLNRVDPEDFKYLVADGASPLDAVGLIRSGYGRDYLEAVGKDEAPDKTWDEATSAYLDAMQSVQNEFRDKFSNEITVRVAGNSEDNAVLVEADGSGPSGRFSYAITEKNGKTLSVRSELTGYSKKETPLTREVLTYLRTNVNGSMSEDFRTMLTSSKDMLAFEESYSEAENG